ncbi:hypothetical protein [Terrabacter terrigena]|uniref:Uncharacterized protein n=1 Tax=Terrabacter terrigena TaxID=574718 RepID=A0ABW3MWC1_9MICO
MSGPSSGDIERTLRTLLGWRLTWWQRLRWWFKDRAGQGLGPNGGYWGGVIVRALAFMRKGAAAAAAFLRRQ